LARWVRRAVRAALNVERVRGRTETSVAIVGDAAIRGLNRTYRAKDVATDVLSFAGDAAAPAIGLPPSRFLGDIVISLDTARRQARRAGHELRDEITLLAVHGTLHLVGHDDETEAGNERMLDAQDRVLDSLRARRAAQSRRRAERLQPGDPR
jgi:probable rRNA maturation factor